MKRTLIAAAALLPLLALPAQAQSTEEALGTVIGGTAGAIIGGEVDNRGSNIEGQVIGAAVGGTLGYVIGDRIDDRNDDERRLRARYGDRAGTFYQKDGRAYRRFQDPDYGYVSFPVRDGDPYYYLDGRRKSHPVFADHPGKGQGKGLRKRR